MKLKQLILLTGFLLTTFIVSAIEFSIACKPGSIRTKGAVISLTCKDSICFYALDLPYGNYIYEAQDGTSTTIGVYSEDQISIGNDSIICLVK